MAIEVALVVLGVEMAAGTLTLTTVTKGMGIPMNSKSLEGATYPRGVSRLFFSSLDSFPPFCHPLSWLPLWLVLVSWNRLLFFLNEPEAF